MNSRIATTILTYTELPVAGPYDGHSGNFDKSRATIDRIIIHTMDGTWEAAAARFNNPASQVSAHYGVKLDGSLIHWLEEYWTAYHSGDYAMNQRSIGIEHEDGGNYNGVRPDALYTTSSKLVADVCKFYSIPCDRDHILKHSEVSDAPTACPDALDIDRIVMEANLILNPAPTPNNSPFGPDVPLVLSDAQPIQLGAALGILTLGSIRSKLLDNARDLASAKTTIEDQQVEITKLQEQVNALQEINKQTVSDVSNAVNSAPQTGNSTTYQVAPAQPEIGLNIASLFSKFTGWLFRQ